MSDSTSTITVPTADELARAVKAFDEDWGAVDEVLYRVCREHSDHTDRRAIMAKMVLVGRAYSAGIERLVKPPKGGQAVTKIADCLWRQRAEVDTILERLRGIEEPLTSDDMKVIVRQHGRLNALLAQNLTRGRSPRSFVSKYLHFHCPVVPIYDDYCSRSLTRRVRWSESAKPFESPAGADADYYWFCVRFMRLYAACRGEGVEARVKDLDALLWQVRAGAAVSPPDTPPQPSFADDAPSASIVCGVDGCPGGWVVVWHDLGSGRMWWEVVSELAVIANASPSPAIIGIDVPIGLVEAGPRECDTLVRQALGAKRGASVFPAPIRPVLAARDHAEASAKRRAVEGKGMSVQSWGIAPKIREVDEALRDDRELRGRIREVHPELCFHYMNGERPLAGSKKKSAGKTERVALLRAQFGDTVLEALASKPRGCASDDLMDAFAAAWTARRVARGEARTIPANPPTDRYDLPMRMIV